MSYSNYMKYLTPEDLVAGEEMAGIDDPLARIGSLQGLQGMADGMRVRGLPERGNSRFIGATSPWEAVGGIAQNAMGAYMNKSLSDRYGDILNKNNLDRKRAYRDMTAKYRSDALRNAGIETFDNAGYGAISDQIDP